jgi:hypothetical protein
MNFDPKKGKNRWQKHWPRQRNIKQDNDLKIGPQLVYKSATILNFKN